MSKLIQFDVFAEELCYIFKIDVVNIENVLDLIYLNSWCKCKLFDVECQFLDYVDIVFIKSFDYSSFMFIHQIENLVIELALQITLTCLFDEE